MNELIPLDIPKHTAEMFNRCLAVLTPPPRLTLSEFADMYRVLSSESSAEPGKWQTDKAPYQREIMDAIGDPSTRRVVIMCAAQLGKTELLLNILAFFMAYQPAPVLVLQPNLDMGQAFSKDRLAPMIRDTPILTPLVDVKSRYSGNTIMKKNFPGGHVTIVGANSPAGLASRPIKVLLADEVDRYPASAGTEGDPLSLAQKRQSNFWDQKTIVVSTPGTKGSSRIEQEFEFSTQEEWEIPCPGCGTYQTFSWGSIRFDSKDLDKGVTMECCHCGESFNEYQWKQGSIHGRYIPRNPGGSFRGFHLNALASLFRSWKKVVEAFLLATDQIRQGNPEGMKTWVNTEMGETWEEKGERLREEELMARREPYGCEVPDGVLFLTAGVDTQDDRLEAEVVGWGKGKESWGIRYQRIYGDMLGDVIWQDLDDFLLQPFYRADGTVMHIGAVCIDSQGHHDKEVSKFVSTRWERCVWAIMGVGGADKSYIPKDPAKKNRYGAPLFRIGVDTGKALLFQRLRVQAKGPNYCHFPLEESAGYNETYFKGLTSEKMVVRFKKGRSVLSWEPIDRAHERNEPLDCRNYASVAMEIRNPPQLKITEELPQVVKAPARRVRSRGI